MLRTHTFLVKLVEQMTYRQLCLLALFNQNVRDQFHLQDGEALKRAVDSLDPAIGLYQEIFQLHQNRMLQQRNPASNTDIILNLQTTNPAHQELTGIGGWLYELMDLHVAISASELRLLADELNAAFRP